MADYKPVEQAPADEDLVRCECGALVLLDDVPAHNAFHDVLSLHAAALAVLQTAHVAGHVHDKYDVPERIDARRKQIEERAGR